MGVAKNQWKRSRRKEISDEFQLSGVYLLNTDGIILSHKDIDLQPDFDVDLFGSMFTAIKIFIEDSLRSSNQLECINYGGFKILIENSKDFFVVLIGTGAITDSVKGNMKGLVERIRQDYGDAIARWKGDVSELMVIDGVLDDFTKSFQLQK